MTEEEHPDDEQQQKRRRLRLHLDDLKANWSPSGGLTLAGGGFVGAVLVVLAWLIFHQPQSQVKPTAAEVQREPISSAGASPFMSPVGQDQPNLTPPANTGGEFSGDTQGLFGEKGDKPSCDAQSLIANLQANPAKANAWADALGLRSEDISSYVASLIPVVLRSDTSVTSHGYADDHFFAYPTVLQAGTAVFVNSYGEPKAKCFSGNPLTKAMSYPQPSYVGPTWQYFQPKSVTVIHRTTTVINNYTIVNVYKGTTVYRPAPRPRYNDDNWYCKRHLDSNKCAPGGGKDSTPPGGKDSSTSGGKDSSTSGGKDSAPAGGKDSSTSGGKDSAPAGGKDSSTSGGKDSAPAGGKDSSTSGGKDSAPAGGKDSSTSGGKDSAPAGGKDSSTSGGKDSAPAGGKDSSTSGGKDSTPAGGKDSSSPGGKDSTTDTGADRGARDSTGPIVK